MGKILMFFLLSGLLGGIIYLNFQQYTIFRTLYKESSVLQAEVEIDGETRYPYTAMFLVFTNSLRRDFTPEKYHKASQKAYIDNATYPYRIIVRDAVTWQEFFNSMPSPFRITADCLTTGTGQTLCTQNEQHALKFYINDQHDPDALNKKIEPGDKLLVSFGADSETTINSQLKILNALK